MNEVWKDVIGFEGLYMVSNMGNVKSLNRWIEFANNGTRAKHLYKGRLLRPRIVRGYSVVSLCKNGKADQRKVHRLVAQAYIPNPENKPEVNHKNGIKGDNSVGNLEWSTRKENQQHAFDNKLQLMGKGPDCFNSIPISQFTKDGTWVRDWWGVSEAHRELGISISSISACTLGHLKTSAGFIWRKKV